MRLMEEEGEVITLYAKPNDEKPYVQFAGLQKGEYIEVDYLSLRTFIFFSDIGSAIRKACMEIDSDTACTLISYSWCEEDKSWIVSVENRKISVLLNSQRYKHFGSYPDAFFISIGLSGEEEIIRKMVKRFLEILGRNPYEGLDWKSLEKKAKLKKDDVVKAWKKFMD